MKTKISKKVLSLCLSLLICISALPVTMLSASAAEYDITIRNVVYPRPGAVPQADIKKESVSQYNLYGWAWMGNDDTVAMGPDEKFKDFFSLVLGSSGDFYYELDTFTDTVSYNLSLIFVLKDKIVISGVECDVVFYDENNTVRGVTQGMFLPVKYARTYAEEAGIALPEDLTDNDTIMVCSTSSMMCCPEDHIHIQGQYSYDDNGHWRECTVCGEKIFDSESKHRKYCTKDERWSCINQATASKEGEYVKQCSGCSYVLEKITVPKTGEQTVVTTYDELRNALAKGGKQWIKLDFPGKTFKQEDFKYDYTLCLDDPDADITIDLNNCILERKTLYDKSLFEIKQGKLRLWQKDGNGIDSTVNFKYNFSFDTGNGEAVFYVADSGSLILTNVHSLSPGSDDIGTFTYAFPIVKSSGNLRIDSGIYYSYNETPAVEIDGGTAVINGGYFKSTYYKSSAVKITAPDKEKTTVEINYGNFGALNTAVYMDRDTVVTINGGNFEYKDTDRNLYQKYALYASDADLTINGGYFYGSLNALDARGLHSLNISYGNFKLYNQIEDGNLAAVYLGGDYSTNTIISGGRYYGNKGIEFSSKTDFSKIIPKGCYVTDDDTGLVIDHNITDYSLGGSIDIFAKRPRITTQPSGGHSLTMGDSIVLKIEAENANEYIWHIIDEEGKELTWNYLSNNGYANPATSEGGKKLFLYGVSDWMTGKRVYCVAKGYGGTVKSDIVTLSVDKVIKYCNDLYFDDFDQIWNHKTVADFKNPKNDADVPYTIGNVRWEMFSKILSDDFEFKSGDNVAVRIDVIPKEGYTFYSTVFGKLNGIDSYATIKNEDGSRSIVFNMTITTPDEYKTQDIELSVAEPVAGKTPATTAVCTSGYAVPGTPAWTPADETFKTNTEYTVKIPVKAEYAWGDTSTVTAKVNGKTATFIKEYKGAKQYAYYVQYTFDATGSEIAKDYDITVEGGKAYNGSGEEITKCNEGATVTLKANDPPEGMDFDRWEVVSGDITLADETDPNTTFVMPANEVSVKAIYDLIPHTHIFDLETIKEKALKTPADCENDAVYYKSCSICEEISDTETFTATDSALGHSFKNYVSDNNATCTADGTKTAKCERCDEKDTVTDTDSAKGHKYSEEWSKDTTHHWHQCSVCSDKKDTEEHIPNIAEPTETQAKVCTVCDYVIADKLPAKNGTVIVDGKTVLYIDGTAVEGTNVVNFEGKTYAVVKGYVVTGKIQTVTISGKTYIVDKNGVIIKSGKNRLVKVNSSKWYVVNKYGIVIKAKSGNTLVKVGSKTYIVNKYGLVQKTTKSKLLNVGKKTYVVVKDSVLTGKTRTITISGKTYIVDKTGAVIKSTANKLVKVSKNNWYVVSKAGTVIKAKKGNILVKVGSKTYIVNKYGLVQKTTKSKLLNVGKKTYAVVKYCVFTGKTRTITIGRKTYIVDKNGAVIKSTANKLVKVSKNNWYVVSKAGTVIKAKKGNILVKVSKKSYIVNKKGLVLKNKKSVKVGKKTYKINKYGIATRKK